jgi:exodeoxyribonuclease VII large subunit
LAGPRQRLDACAERLPRALRANAQIHHTQFSRVSGRLSPQLLRTAVERRRIRLDACTQRLGTALKTYRETKLTGLSHARDRLKVLVERSHRAMHAFIANRDVRIERSFQLLQAFSYQSVLKRGFALVRDGSGHPLRSAATVAPDMPLDIEFSDGCVSATAKNVRQTSEPSKPEPAIPAAWKPRKPKTSTGGSSGQGSLFS